jgi:hypothetical protein
MATDVDAALAWIVAKIRRHASRRRQELISPSWREISVISMTSIDPSGG